MGESIAVALLTCVRDSDERYRYLERGLSSFLEHNPPRYAQRFLPYHGDDYSTDPRVLSLVHAAGFQTVWKATKPYHGDRPWLRARRALLAKVDRVAPPDVNWVLFLEDDCEWVRPFPWDLFDMLADDRKVDCLQLYGEFKDEAQQQPRLQNHKETLRPVVWRPVKRKVEAAEGAHVHWSAQPCVTRRPVIMRHHYDQTEPTGRTVRVVENVTNHIGKVRTATR